MKPNKSRTCVADTYCRINRTELVQLGDGLKLICPRCDTIYDPEEIERRVETYRQMMNRKYGWPITAA